MKVGAEKYVDCPHCRETMHCTTYNGVPKSYRCADCGKPLRAVSNNGLPLGFLEAHVYYKYI